MVRSFRPQKGPRWSLRIAVSVADYDDVSALKYGGVRIAEIGAQILWARRQLTVTPLGHTMKK
jgi:hypothetical protein